MILCIKTLSTLIKRSPTKDLDRNPFPCLFLVDCHSLARLVTMDILDVRIELQRSKQDCEWMNLCIFVTPVPMITALQTQKPESEQPPVFYEGFQKKYCALVSRQPLYLNKRCDGTLSRRIRRFKSHTYTLSHTHCLSPCEAVLQPDSSNEGDNGRPTHTFCHGRWRLLIKHTHSHMH